MTNISDTLAALSAKAPPGEWEIDSEYDQDGAYGGGPDHGTGYRNYFIGVDVNGKWATLLDTVNSDHKLIEEDYDEDGEEAWDVIGRANVMFIVALVNAYRTGQLVPVPSVERIRKEAFEEAAKVAYRVCAETRHVSLGEVVATAVIAAMQEGRE